MKRKKEDNDVTKRIKIKNAFLTFIEIALVCVMAFSGVKIVLWSIENNKSGKLLEDVNNAVKISSAEVDSELDKYSINFLELSKTNEEVVGWIKVNNTNIEYPVVQAKDNDYYLHHSLDKSSNSAGWVFADFRNRLDGTDRNVIVYGHNRKDMSMFGSLQYALDSEWCDNEENRKIVFITKDAKYMYEIFSVYTIRDENYYITTDFVDENTKFSDFIDKIKSRSYYDFGIDVNDSDKILTLSTCNVSNHKTVVHAKKIEEKLQK